MYPIKSYQLGGKDRYSAKKNAKPVNFICVAPEAKQVSIIGDFNGWNPAANPMRRLPDGGWQAQVPLPHGHHRYLFYIDGSAALDPRAQGIGRTENNERVSLIAIS
jgi:1,4-alpha-glucan branching enzyme